MTKKQFLMIPAAIFLFFAGLSLGYVLGSKEVNDAANKRAAEMILNDEIPNYYLEVETVDYLINNKSGKLDELVKPKPNPSQKK